MHRGPLSKWQLNQIQISSHKQKRWRPKQWKRIQICEIGSSGVVGRQGDLTIITTKHISIKKENMKKDIQYAREKNFNCLMLAK